MKPSKLKTLLVEYGSLALYTYLVLFALVLAGFVLAITLGFKTDTSVGKLGVLGAAWVATKLTQPLRILASIALTPIVARWFKVEKKQVAPSEPG